MFNKFGVKDAIDILLVAVLLYQTYKVMKSSGSGGVFSGIISFIALWVVVSHVFEMRLLGSILDKFVDVGFFVLVVLFQDEIRRVLQRLGSNRGWKFITRLLAPRSHNVKKDVAYAMPIVMACMNMAKTKTGALIVVQQTNNLSLYEETGEKLNADISSRLLENIFFKNSPLHDGAVIVNKQKIKAAGCILPVSQKTDIPKELGLRHRSALGISQETDAKVIIVSEERGKISLASQGHLHLNISAEELQKLLISTD
jgi:TIGR00159 family protein